MDGNGGIKNMMERLEESVQRKLDNLESATFSSAGGLNYHASSINVDMRELEAQISDLRSQAILHNNSKKLEESEKWSKRHTQLVAQVHQSLLQAKKRLGRRQLLLGKKNQTDLGEQLEIDLKDKFSRVERSLKESVDRSMTSTTKLQQGTAGMKNVSHSYREFENVTALSKRLIRHYAKKEDDEWRWFLWSIAFFLIVVLVILYYRFPFVRSIFVPFGKFLFSKTRKLVTNKYRERRPIQTLQQEEL
jgi:hypothetical protein